MSEESGQGAQAERLGSPRDAATRPERAPAGFHPPHAEAARISRAVETAWNLGTGHRLAGSTSPHYGDSPEGRALLAAALGLPGGGHDAAAPDAADAYADAFDLAGRLLEDPDTARYPGYLEGQQVITALGRTGVLTGESEARGYPFVRFGDGPAVPVPRSVIAGPVTHMCDDVSDAHALAKSRADLLAEGDTVRVRSSEQVFVCRAGPIWLTDEASSQGIARPGRDGTVNVRADSLNWTSTPVRPTAPSQRSQGNLTHGQAPPGQGAKKTR